MRASIRALLIATTILLVVGCSEPPIASGQVRLATSARGAFDVGCPMALIEGELIADADAGTAIHGASGTPQVIWPFGFVVREADARVEVLDAGGSVVATTGETVKLGGGMITADHRWSTCGPPLERH